MDRPWSPVEVEIKMAEVIEALENAVATQKALGEAARRASNAAKLEESKMLLASRNDVNLKTDTLRKAWVFTEIADLVLAADIAEVQYDAQKNVVRALQSEGDLLRSLGRSHRDMTDSGGWGGPPQHGDQGSGRPLQPPAFLRSAQ